MELDHVGLAVASLDEAAAVYGRLGFQLTPRSFHSGSREPGGPVEPWGSGNHCAMFQNGYLELIGITDAALYNPVEAFLAKYSGLHIIAFGVENADQAYDQLSARGGEVAPPYILQRQAAFGAAGSETRLAQFRNMAIDASVHPEAHMIFIQHMTRDVLWQPHLLAHPNGAVSMLEVGICVADLADASARFARLLGAEAREAMPGVNLIDLARGRVYLMSEAGLEGWIPGIEPPALPWVATFGVGVGDLAATEAFLTGQGLHTQRHPYPALWLAPEQTLGPVVSFIQA